MTDIDETIAEAARRHGLSEGAVGTLWDALVAGRGSQAQFSHPELGGMGQWSSGMLQIGDMFNYALKAKVAAACSDLAALAARASPAPAGSHQSQWQGDAQPLGTGPSAAWGFAPIGGRPWWPEHLGQPASSGAQNDARYAFFPDKRRLAVERDGAVMLYDTGEHRISGFSQQQSTCSAMALTSQFGAVMLDGLPVVTA